jgi:hypothetical protein
MKVRAALLALVFVVAMTAQAWAIDATAEWDAAASQYNFPTVAAATLAGTFATEYYGSDFKSDFRTILDLVAQALGTSTPAYSGEVGLKAGVENWPDP